LSHAISSSPGPESGISSSSIEDSKPSEWLEIAERIVREKREKHAKGRIVEFEGRASKRYKLNSILRTALSEGSKKERIFAAQALGIMKNISGLKEALYREEFEDAFQEMTQVLARVGTIKAIEIIVETILFPGDWISDAYRKILIETIAGLKKTKLVEKAVDMLVESLNNAQAISGLELLAEIWARDDNDFLEHLFRELVQQRGKNLQTLGIFKKAVSHFIRFALEQIKVAYAEGDTERIHYWFYSALVFKGKAVPPLINALKDEEPVVRFGAILNLTELYYSHMLTRQKIAPAFEERLREEKDWALYILMVEALRRWERDMTSVKLQIPTKEDIQKMLGKINTKLGNRGYKAVLKSKSKSMIRMKLHRLWKNDKFSYHDKELFGKLITLIYPYFPFAVEPINPFDYGLRTRIPFIAMAVTQAIIICRAGIEIKTCRIQFF